MKSHQQHPNPPQQQSAGGAPNRSSVSRNSSSIRGSKDSTQAYASKQSPIVSYSNRNSSHMIYQEQATKPPQQHSNLKVEIPTTHGAAGLMINRIQIVNGSSTTSHTQQASHIISNTATSTTNAPSGNTTARTRQDFIMQQRPQGQTPIVPTSRTATNTPGQHSPFLLSSNTGTSSVGTRAGASTNSNTSSRKQTPEKNGHTAAGGAAAKHNFISKNEQNANYVKYFREFDDIHSHNNNNNTAGASNGFNDANLNGHTQHGFNHHAHASNIPTSGGAGTAGVVQKRKVTGPFDKSNNNNNNNDDSVHFANQKRQTKFLLFNNAYDRRNTHANPSLDTSMNPFFQQQQSRQSSEASSTTQNGGAFLEGLNVSAHLDQSIVLNNPMNTGMLQPQYEAFLANKVRGKRSIEQPYHSNQPMTTTSSGFPTTNGDSNQFHMTTTSGAATGTPAHAALQAVSALGQTYTPSSANKHRAAIVGTQNSRTPAALNYSLDKGHRNQNIGTVHNNNNNNNNQSTQNKIPFKQRGNSLHDGQSFVIPSNRQAGSSLQTSQIQQQQQQQQQTQNNFGLKQKTMYANHTTTTNNQLQQQRTDSAADDASFIQGAGSIHHDGLFYERGASFEFNRFQINHLDTTMSTMKMNVNEKSFDADLDTTLHHIHKIPSYIHSSSQQQSHIQPVSPQVAELIEAGQKLFKESNYNQAISCFMNALKHDSLNLDLKYFLGVCYLGKADYEEAVKEFLAVIEKNPNCRRNIYLLISIAFKKLGNIPSAIRMLTKVISNNPQYYDAFIYRGKLYIKEKAWEKAESDFESAIQIQPEKGLAYLGKADCLRSMNRFSEAVSVYTQAMKTESFLKQNALLKRAIALIDEKKYEQALEDLIQVIEVEEDNSEAYYFKGMVHYKLKDLSEAGLSFEQAVKFNKSKKSVTKSLYEIARIKIEQRDFYQAHHTLSRSDFLDTDKKLLEKFRLFTEAVIFLMKRKFKEAIDNFNLITQNFTLGDFLKPLFYIYRAYGYFCLGKHQLALYDYLASDSQLLSADSNSTYNYTLTQGILAVTSGKFDTGISFFKAAESSYSNKMEPSFYNGMTYITMAFNNQSESQNHSESAANQNSSTAQTSSVSFAVGSQKPTKQQKADLIAKGLREMDKAVQICDSNANLYYYRAIVRCYLGYFDKALPDIDKAIEKSEDNVPKYFYLRGHSFACCKQFKQAISDLSIAIQLDENYADAFLERAKCYHFADESNHAFADLQKYISLRPSDPNIHLYAGNLLFNNGAYEDAIRAYTHSDLIETNPELLLLRAKCSIVLLELSAALKDITTILTLQNSRSLSFDRACLTALLSILDTLKVDKDKQVWSCKQGLEKTAKVSSGITSEQNGRIFDNSDLLLYRGILEFYSGSYPEALSTFNNALQQFSLNQLETQSIRGDLVILFNIVMTQIMLKKYSEAAETCVKLAKLTKDSSQNSCYKILNRILLAEREGISFTSDLSEEDVREALANPFFQESSEIRLFEQLPLFDLKLKAFDDIHMRLMLGFPLVEAPDLQPVFQMSLIETISVTNVENKPEAPWIRRNTNGVIFTDNIQVFEHLDIDTEENQKASGDNDRRIEIDRMKAKLMLDKDIENKLKTINKTGAPPKKLATTTKQSQLS